MMNDALDVLDVLKADWIRAELVFFFLLVHPYTCRRLTKTGIYKL